MSTTTRLGAIDAAWLHMERATNPMMITGVLWFAGPVDHGDIRQVLQERLLAVYPKFTQRVVDPVGPMPPRWEPDPAFHLDNHLLHVALPEPGDRATLQALVSDLASSPLDMRFSPWQFHLVDGFDGASALIGRIHHCVADGIALARVLLGLTDGSGQLPPTHPAVRRRAWGDVPLAAAHKAIRALDGAADAVLHPERIVNAMGLAADGALEVEYLVTMSKDAATLLKAPLGARKRVAWADPIPLADVKAVGKRLGCTVNDVLVSAMAGALGAHLAGEGAAVSTIRAFVPVNLRPLDKPIPRDLGNEFSLVVLELPVGEPDPLKRLERVHVAMEKLKNGVEPAVTWALFHLLGRTPALVERWIVDFFGSKATAVFTNVPGPREVVTMAGVPVRGVMVWVPQSGPIGLGLSIFSYNGEVTVGVSADERCLHDPQSLADRFATAFAALERA